jgi:hypothetical protein
VISRQIKLSANNLLTFATWLWWSTSSRVPLHWSLNWFIVPFLTSVQCVPGDWNAFHVQNSTSAYSEGTNLVWKNSYALNIKRYTLKVRILINPIPNIFGKISKLFFKKPRKRNTILYQNTHVWLLCATILRWSQICEDYQWLNINANTTCSMVNNKNETNFKRLP